LRSLLKIDIVGASLMLTLNDERKEEVLNVLLCDENIDNEVS